MVAPQSLVPVKSPSGGTHTQLCAAVFTAPPMQAGGWFQASQSEAAAGLFCHTSQAARLYG